MSDYFEKKKDKGKIRWLMLPWSGLENVVKIMEFGQFKGYGMNSWQDVPNAEERYVNAAIRHMAAICKEYEQTHDIETALMAADDESGLPHLDHAACCLLFLSHFNNKNKQKTKINNHIPSFEEL